MIERVGLGWQLGVSSGWGTYGVNLAVQLARKGVIPGIFLIAPKPTVTEAQAAVLGPALAEYPRWNTLLQQRVAALDFPFLHALGDKLTFPPETIGLQGRPDIGVVFFESAVIPPANLAIAQRLALIITGSSWNADVLRRHGFDRVVNCPQGVDLGLFNPGPREGHFKDRFAIFSGGKLEYRKGQDLVVAAFKRFHAGHPDSLLVTAWHNPWPESARTIALSPHITGSPGVNSSGHTDAAGWLKANGISEGAFFDVGQLPNVAIPSLLREVDLAVFPNRCEGGTNLVAMECMATGVPVVLSRNTGHLDLIAPETCYSLDLQIPMGEITGRAEMEGWGESSIDELVTRMTEAYEDRTRAASIGRGGADFMKTWDWSTQTDRLLAALAQVC